MTALLSSLVIKGPLIVLMYFFFSGAFLFSIHSTVALKRLKCSIFRGFELSSSATSSLQEKLSNPLQSWYVKYTRQVANAIEKTKLHSHFHYSVVGLVQSSHTHNYQQVSHLSDLQLL